MTPPAASPAAERTGGAAPQWLRKGGAGGKGIILEDDKTLAECGLDYTMGMFEVRQRTSAARQRQRRRFAPRQRLSTRQQTCR